MAYTFLQNKSISVLANKSRNPS